MASSDLILTFTFIFTIIIQQIDKSLTFGFIIVIVCINVTFILICLREVLRIVLRKRQDIIHAVLSKAQLKCPILTKLFNNFVPNGYRIHWDTLRKHYLNNQVERLKKLNRKDLRLAQ